MWSVFLEVLCSLHSSLQRYQLGSTNVQSIIHRQTDPRGMILSLAEIYDVTHGAQQHEQGLSHVRASNLQYGTVDFNNELPFLHTSL